LSTKLGSRVDVREIGDAASFPDRARHPVDQRDERMSNDPTVDLRHPDVPPAADDRVEQESPTVLLIARSGDARVGVLEREVSPHFDELFDVPLMREADGRLGHPGYAARRA
jgi:hypothetical protein